MEVHKEKVMKIVRDACEVTHFEELDLGDVFTVAYNDQTFMVIENGYIEDGCNVNAVNLSSGELFLFDAKSEVTAEYNARVVIG